MSANFISALPLGIDAVKILLHLFNFAILFVGLTLLLYKPVLKFIKKRQDTIAGQIKTNEETKAAAEEALNDYRQKLDNAENEIDAKKAAALKEVAADKEMILAQAKAKADNILKKADEESERERAAALSMLHDELADVAVTIASNILEREISKEENAKIIDDCINEWSQND